MLELHIYLGAILKKFHIQTRVLNSKVLSKLFAVMIRDKHQLTIEDATTILNDASPRPTGTSIVKNQLVEKTFDLKVIIPVYNSEKYVSQCLNSIVSQKSDYKVEILVIDDGSTDGSVELVKKYKQSNVKLIKQANKGVSSARNLGLKTLNSKYLMFFDSDDVLEDNAIQVLLDEAFKRDADVVEGSFNRLSNNKKHLGIIHEDLDKADDAEFYGFPWGKVVKSEMFANLRFPIGYWFEDTIFSYLIYPQVSMLLS
ncbi:glycosyltransferase [Pediococcus inopinatus]|uniref:Glycosyltransferase n=1 Tax=Pediococcus inopinatus TaxID=114090 RepID=A0ABZ0Q609_9LACO|nr:glycosyltransferase [Pediococcus inopinatus]WPC22381.1 glycosyltransferase [Pediococcus inopinatus]